jgi:hypothetical protein
VAQLHGTGTDVDAFGGCRDLAISTAGDELATATKWCSAIQ